ncbi:MAG: phosphotransferase [Candidatus Syntrophonatronum acetioxidans]|uniref:protein-tyrosine-phosphatase n=1 Tax=Candidatus Syntrophonatronum acetioxidans TaxID=1795816 RepID=A0A424YBM3_9FIRM|nr:MAG: phosphotransferase [Candidatus Syntrophonatronum acetioxidans]
MPGLDDGPSSLEESLQTAWLAWEKGITRMVATPHVVEGVYDHTREIIVEKTGELKRELERAGCPLVIYPGAEILLSKSLLDLIKEDRLTTLGNSTRYFFLEIPVNQPFPSYLGNILFQVRLKGFVPVIPHPERILSVQDNPNILIPLIQGGTLMQVTLTSLAGVMGKRAEKTARILLDCHMVHLLATDLHGPGPRLDSFEKGVERLGELAGKEAIGKYFKEVPEQILGGEEIEVPEPQEYKPLGPWQSFIKGFRKNT